ncbi:sigma 54-interacting transcriptional regulator [candidate division KSB1 bacterium]|nr:sigma 54-interacting transcriptional regulator [candidate division KSB1 bacterium]
MSPDYKILAEIHRGRKRVVYRGQRLSDQAPIIVKTLIDGFPHPADIAGLQREYDLISNLPIEGIAKALALEHYHNSPALILDDSGGESLRNLIDSKGIDLDIFFEISLQLSATLAAIHQHEIIHKDIAPKNIIINLAKRQVQLIDFSIASRLPHENQKISHPNLLEGTLAYMSPEQTGRMNRSIDYRTDLYSLGVTFYEMLTGRLPFELADPLELVHAHIAKVPAPPERLNPGVPKALSDIVMKLMAKTAENRYQSAHGLHADLESCFAQWQANGKIVNFRPGQNDFSDRFHIPQKLYGREQEIAALLAAFDRISRGATEIMLVSGYSGIGKSALVNEVHKPIAKQRGYFIAGKFDQLKRNIPYSAVIHALQELVRLLLAESEQEIAAWKDKLSNALGPNGQVITGVIPEVEWIIGVQPAVPELPPAESQNRFLLVFQRFISVFTQPEHPLVIFLDDLQWADSATLKLLQALMTDPQSRYLFVIGAYRDNEVNAAHPLMLTLTEIEKSDTKNSSGKLNSITLKALDFAHLNQFVADTLRREAHDSASLTDLIAQKTAGNPFFVTQFLRTLHQEKLLEFDYREGFWQFDLARIQRLGITDNVVDLMAGKIQKLPAATRHVTKLAACIGNQFDGKTLALVNEKPVQQTVGELGEAVREGLILPLGNAYELLPEASSEAEFRFLHDRVQQAAYALIPEERKKSVHLQVGRLMLQHGSGAEREEKLFDIVNHLNLGSELMTAAEERVQLAKLNLHAGLKAKSATAYKPTLNYFNAGLNLLGHDGWPSQYDLMFALHRELAECEYLCGNFGAAERYFALLLDKAATRLERAEIHSMRIIQYENMAKYVEAVQAGREGLRLFGIVLPETKEAKQSAFEAELLSIQNRRGDRAIADLIHLPVMSDAEMKMSMKLLMTVWAPAYIAGDGDLATLVSAMMVRLSLEYGNTEASSYGYVTHAITAGSGLGDYKSGYEYGCLALAVNEKFHDLKLRAKTHHMFSCFVNFWRQPIRTCFTHSKDAYRSGLEIGDFVYATYAAIHESWHAFFSGYELPQFQKDYSPNVSFLDQIKNYSFADAQRLILHWGLALQGLTSSKTSFTDATFDEAAYLKNYTGAAFFETFYYTMKLNVHYLFENYEEARKMALKAESAIHALFGTLWMTTLCFYHALTLAALYGSAEDEKQRDDRQKLESLQAQMKLWAANCPENFQHEFLLISAEMARITDKPYEAMVNYEQAIQSAREQGIIQHEALANELCAKFWLERNNGKIARSYMAEARYGYQQWGAQAKARDLEQRYPQLFAPVSEESNAPITWPASQFTIGRRLESLDLQTVIKASHAISSEITLARLLEKLMRIVLENAGAQKGILILEKEGKLFIEAEAAVGKEDEIIVLQSIPIETSRALSPAIVNYVRRTHESLVVAEAVADSRFLHDPYILQNQTRSLFCLPILHQNKLSGILYLENNLTTAAFTPDRIAVMQMLSAQAAIALENAGLYEEMKQEVAERKRAEEALRAALEEVEQLKNRLQAENVYLQEEIRTHQNFEEIAGASAAMQAVFRNIEKVAHTDTTVLITGETGTGKELVARAIHSSSSRKESALITVNCSALPSGLIESELFGHEKGAFTGATAKKKGRFELADGGTIFLDEIGELPLETQAKLLRVLQEQEFERVGSTQTFKVNTRVIAATNRDLEQEVKLGSFRADLFYRLNIFPIHLPMLRERRDDIPVLTHHFVSKFSRRLGKKIDRVASEALERLTRYDWPGNVRELANVLERAVILCDGGVLQNDHLSISLQPVKPETEMLTMQEAERRHILKALEESNWVVGGANGAAMRLGLNRTTLLAKMKKLGIEKEPA